MKKLITLAIGLFICVAETLSAQGLYEEITTYQADRSTLARKYTITSSDEYYNRMIRLQDDWLTTLEAKDFASLSNEGKADYVLFKNLLEKQKYFLQKEQQEFREVAHVADFGEPIYTFIRERRRGKKPDAPQLAKAFHQALSDLEKQKSRIAAAPKFTSWQTAERASEVILNLQTTLKEAYEFYYGYDIEFSWWMEEPYATLHKSLDAYAVFLRDYYTNTSVKDDGSGIIGKPLGREAILQSLAFEYIPYTPEELIKIGEQEYAWCEKELLKASAALGYGNDWKAALEHVKNTYVPPGQWPSDVNELAEEAITFLEERDLITIPDMAKESWRMVMLSPERQLVSPFFLGGEQIMIAYPTNTMAHDAKMMSLRGNNPYFSRATVQHELIPGHHLQQYSQQRHKPYRRVFNTPFWVEGWALYWEFNLWEKEFPRTPEERIGMLFWRMHRCARIIFSLNYHLNKMTPQECIDFLVEKVGHERANAEAEVRRSFTGRYGPLYQLAYMIGGLQISQLKTEVLQSGKMSEKEFHDEIMQQNVMPIEILRAILLQEPLPKDYKSAWKFYTFQTKR